MNTRSRSRTTAPKQMPTHVAPSRERERTDVLCCPVPELLRSRGVDDSPGAVGTAVDEREGGVVLRWTGMMPSSEVPGSEPAN
jgi:hypothetical protein